MDVGVTEDLFQRVEFIGALIVDLLDPGVDEDLDAVDAGGVG